MGGQIAAAEATGNLWIVVPARGIRDGKSRLAGVLTPAQREALNVTLLERVLSRVRDAAGGLTRCIVVSPCVDTLMIAARTGAEPLHEAPAFGVPAESALNAALDQARARLRSRHAARMLVLPSDLATLTVESLRALITRAVTPGTIVLAPDAREDGTNALALDTDLPFTFAFGPGSFESHRDEAAAIGMPVVIVRDAPLAFDLDTPDDLERWRQPPAKIGLGRAQARSAPD